MTAEEPLHDELFMNWNFVAMGRYGMQE